MTRLNEATHNRQNNPEQTDTPMHKYTSHPNRAVAEDFSSNEFGQIDNLLYGGINLKNRESIDEPMSTNRATTAGGKNKGKIRSGDPNQTNVKDDNATTSTLNYIYVVWSSESSPEHTQPTIEKTVTEHLPAASTQELANHILELWVKESIDSGRYKVVNESPDSDGNSQCMLVGREPGKSVILHIMVAKVQYVEDE